MSSMPDNTCPPECRQNWRRASDPVEHVGHCPRQINDRTAYVTVADDRRVYLCCGRVDNEAHRNFCEYYRTAEAPECPEWCTTDHAGTDDDRDDLVLHMSSNHVETRVKELADAHQLDIRVARTDFPSDGTSGVPNLYVRYEVEVTSWEQAAELARMILDGFGYLEGAQ